MRFCTPWKKKSKAIMGCAAIKIDFEKAFHHLEWGFIFAILRNLGYHQIFIWWTDQCISSLTFSELIINGNPKGFFRSSCGVHRGDPLSPRLFILSMEILSRLFVRAENGGQIKGTKLVRNSPPITHLLFCGWLDCFHESKWEKCEIL